MQDSVTQDRQKYIGGSDIPVIMGISPFKTRWELLQEKAGLHIDLFEGNIYTRYGQVMEAKIRDYINNENYLLGIDEFVEGKHVVEGDPIGIRCHTDGENVDTVLEVKTTGGNVDMLVYEVQLLFYMMNAGKEHGIIAVYTRPADMSEKFNPELLEQFTYDICDYEDLCEKINEAVTSFIEDLKALKENPDMAEEDVLPSELIAMSSQVIALEAQLKELKEVEKKAKEMKAKLYEEMARCGVKSWKTPNDVKITLVEAKPAEEKTVEEFDEEAFEKAEPELYKKYVKTVTVTSGGKNGYVLITLPKEKKQ